MHNVLFAKKLPVLCRKFDTHKIIFFGGEEKFTSLTIPDVGVLEESMRKAAKQQARQTGEEFVKGRCGKGAIPLGLLAQESKVLFGLIKTHGVKDWAVIHSLFPQEGKGIYTRGINDLK
jgi:hypothetical protein